MNFNITENYSLRPPFALAPYPILGAMIGLAVLAILINILVIIILICKNKISNGKDVRVNNTGYRSELTPLLELNTISQYQQIEIESEIKDRNLIVSYRDHISHAVLKAIVE